MINIEEVHCIYSEKGINYEESDVDNRRNSRTSMLVSILLLSGTFFTILCKASLRFFRVYYFNNLTWLLLAFFSLCISIVLILIYDIVRYVFYELLRNNVKKENYIGYDNDADISYHYLINDLYFFILIVFISFLFVVFCLPRENRNFAILQRLLLLIVIFYFAYKILKFIKEKKEYNKILMNKIFITFILALGASMFIVSYFNVINGTLTMKYGSEGSVVISNSSNVKFGRLFIRIYNDDSDLYNNTVDMKDILFAEEEKYYIDVENANELTAIDLLSGDYQWKYLLNLNDIIKENGKYKIEIDYTVKNKSIKIYNDIFFYDKEFILGNDNIIFNY